MLGTLMVAIGIPRTQSGLTSHLRPGTGRTRINVAENARGGCMRPVRVRAATATTNEQDPTDAFLLCALRRRQHARPRQGEERHGIASG